MNRRGFLKSLAASSALVAAAPIAPILPTAQAREPILVVCFGASNLEDCDGSHGDFLDDYAAQFAKVYERFTDADWPEVGTPETDDMWIPVERSCSACRQTS